MKIDEYMKSTERPVDLCKEIDELRAENQMLRNQNNMLTCFCDDCKKIEKLQKENNSIKQILINLVTAFNNYECAGPVQAQENTWETLRDLMHEELLKIENGEIAE